MWNEVCTENSGINMFHWSIQAPVIPQRDELIRQD
jgi:hypothetical protein